MESKFADPSKGALRRDSLCILLRGCQVQRIYITVSSARLEWTTTRPIKLRATYLINCRNICEELAQIEAKSSNMFEKGASNISGWIPILSEGCLRRPWGDGPMGPLGPLGP